MKTSYAIAWMFGIVAVMGLSPVASAQSWSTTPGGPIFNAVRYYSAGQTIALETYNLAPATADTTLRLFSTRQQRQHPRRGRLERRQRHGPGLEADLHRPRRTDRILSDRRAQLLRVGRWRV